MTAGRSACCASLTNTPGECLAIHVRRKLNSQDVLYVLGKLFVSHGPPQHIRSDNGPEFIAQAVRGWLGKLDVKTLYIEPGSPWENGYCESYNGKLRDECLNREIFFTLKEAQVSSNNGDASTTPNVRTHRLVIARPRQRPSCL